MEFYKFSEDSGKKISKFNSDFVMSHIIQTEKPTHVGCMYLEKNGIIGYHQAVVPQLLLIMNGEGYVRGDKEESIKVQSGDAVFWEKNEWHETKTDTGFTAIVIESEELSPSSFMPLKK
jgi:quercetin dioxygenase-like cupin family protein